VKLPFEPSALAQAAGLAALDDDGFVEEYINLVRVGLNYFYERLDKMGVTYVPSVTNFVMVDFSSEAKATEIYEKLLCQGVIVRPLVRAGLPQCVRITIGLPEENQKCMDAIEQNL
jgi:histidinol-phosphate aminotransferase